MGRPGASGRLLPRVGPGVGVPASRPGLGRGPEWGFREVCRRRRPPGDRTEEAGPLFEWEALIDLSLK